MDTSKEYIAMCAAAEEIQGNASDFKNGMGKGLYYSSELNKTVWMPSQDQLQELCLSDGIFKLLHKFNNFIFYPDERDMLFRKNPPYSMNTAEQLWLAFVMQEKYGKRWNGEKWEKMQP